MKRIFPLRALPALASAGALSLIAGLTLTLGSAADASVHSPDPRSVVFAPDARPYGLPMSTWGQLINQWIYAQPFGVNPAYDQTGADCGIDQHGPAWFIPPIFAPPGTHHPIIQNASRTCTVPAHHALLLDLGSIVDDYPCPDPTFTPPPGESLYDFLVADAKPVMDSVNELDVSVDGVSVPGVLSYRFHSARLFQIKGDLSLQAVLDGCITGTFQPAIIDGFFMMVKPLEPGTHTIVVHGTNSIGDDRTYTYHLTVAR
jgi:hypothetical protein